MSSKIFVLFFLLLSFCDRVCDLKEYSHTESKSHCSRIECHQHTEMHYKCKTYVKPESFQIIVKEKK